MRLIRFSPLLMAAFAWQAIAQTQAPAPDTMAHTVTLGVPITTSSLETLRGGADTTVNDMRLNGTTASNTARQVNTGSNMVTDGSFANLSGIPVVIQNTGANVLIQNAVILNLQMH
jgi:hypothetical protein